MTSIMATDIGETVVDLPVEEDDFGDFGELTEAAEPPAAAPPIVVVEEEEDDFGDFGEADLQSPPMVEEEPVVEDDPFRSLSASVPSESLPSLNGVQNDDENNR